jgi:hypothetical protein
MRPEIGKYETDSTPETNAAEGKAGTQPDIDVEAHGANQGCRQDDEAEAIAYA